MTDDASESRADRLTAASDSRSDRLTAAHDSRSDRLTAASDSRDDRLQSALAIEELVSANAQSNATMAALVDHVKKETAARDRKIATLEANTHQMRILAYAVVATMVLLLVMATFNAVNISAARKNAVQTAAIAHDAGFTNRLLLDCMNSTGECGKLNAENQAKLLAEVKKYELTGFYCARTNPAVQDPEGEAFIVCMDRLYPGGPKLQGR